MGRMAPRISARWGPAKLSAMQIGIPRESLPGEHRVAATTTVPQLIKVGYTVVVETGAGQRASFPDSAFELAGAQLGSKTDVWGSDIVLAVNEPVSTNSSPCAGVRC